MKSTSISVVAALQLASALASTPLYKDALAPVPARVADLLSRMNQAEKFAQLLSFDSGPLQPILDQYNSTGFGSVTALLFASTSSLQNLQARNAAQAAIYNSSRLNIPVSFRHEGLHSGCGTGTIFPMPSLISCSWDDALAQSIGAVLANESRACGVDDTWSPVVNMWTDDRFGRYQEGFSPDPTITAHMGVAFVLGIQGGVGTADDYLPDITTNVRSTSKHFAAYGAAIGGLNGAPPAVDNRTLFEQFLRPWRAMAAVGLRGAMPSHNTVNHIPMHGNTWMLQNVMRQEFGFGNGTYVSDCNDIGALPDFGVALNFTYAAAFGINASVDMDLVCGSAFDTYVTHLPAALAGGLITQESIDTLVSHVLTSKFATGLFDMPFSDLAWIDRLNSSANRAVAYSAAAESIVLLKNEGSILPLNFSAPGLRVALIGPQTVCAPSLDAGAAWAAARTSYTGAAAAAPNTCFARVNMLGSYTLDEGVVDVPLLPDALATAFPSLQFTVSTGASIDSDDTSMIAAAVAAAQAADVAVVALGDSLKSCGEWVDRDSLDLPGSQLALLTALAATGKPLVVVLIHGRAATFGPGNALLNNISALLVAWRPGQLGATALVDILSGAVNPSGKLTNQWATSVGQMGSGAAPFLQRVVGKWVANARSPPDLDGRIFDPYVQPVGGNSYPLFRFGAGESYTSWTYNSINVAVSAPDVTQRAFSGRGRAGYLDALKTTVLSVNVSLCNSGARDGTEIVQVYSQDPRFVSTIGVVPYWKRLVGYTRITLPAGQCGSALVSVTADDLAQYDDGMTLRVIPGDYIIRAGGRSDTDALTAPVTLAG